ncbi:MAG: TrmH family RNA methyltransferase [bacterium]|nr:TrmH family RNA methyltransferase [bacterium]
MIKLCVNEKFAFSLFTIMHRQTKRELINYLLTFISEKRKQRFDEVISQRTDHLRIVLENMYQAHNASAILRSCESFGVQHVHFIENRNHLRISDDVAMGSSNWITIHRHNAANTNTVEAINELKAMGYRIVATSPHKNDVTIDQLPVDKKLALVFGTEIDGISEDVISLADEFVKIPMFGFTESFNVSVSAALCMYELSARIRIEVPDYLIGEKERVDIYFDWLMNSIDKSEALIARYLKEKKV